MTKLSTRVANSRLLESRVLLQFRSTGIKNSVIISLALNHPHSKILRTLQRLSRKGFIRRVPPSEAKRRNFAESTNVYELTNSGSAQLEELIRNKKRKR